MREERGEGKKEGGGGSLEFSIISSASQRDIVLGDKWERSVRGASGAGEAPPPSIPPFFLQQSKAAAAAAVSSPITIIVF